MSTNYFQIEYKCVIETCNIFVYFFLCRFESSSQSAFVDATFWRQKENNLQSKLGTEHICCSVEEKHLSFWKKWLSDTVLFNIKQGLAMYSPPNKPGPCQFFLLNKILMAHSHAHLSMQFTDTWPRAWKTGIGMLQFYSFPLFIMLRLLFYWNE